VPRCGDPTRVQRGPRGGSAIHSRPGRLRAQAARHAPCNQGILFQGRKDPNMSYSIFYIIGIVVVIALILAFLF
jgi:hypothetical protein